MNEQVVEQKKKKRKRAKFSYSLQEVKNIHEETLKVAKVTIPSKGYESKLAESNSVGFLQWLKYANDWSQICDNQLEDFVDLFNEAHRKILESGDEKKARIFYSELTAYSALGIAKALSKIKLLLVKIIST